MRGRQRWSSNAATGRLHAVVLVAGALLFGIFGASCGCSEDPCSVRVHEDGSSTITCPDGSTVHVPGLEQEQPKGGIRGTARYFGRESHAGIRVKLLSSDEEIVTDATGSFEFAEVSAGLHQISVDADGYEPHDQGDLMVLPGAWTSEDVELEVGRMILRGEEWTLQASPRGDVFLVVSANPGNDLYLVRPELVEAERIGARVESAWFSPDGAKVVMLAERDGAHATLAIYEVDNGRRTTVAKQVVGVETADFGRRPRLTADGDTLVFERTPEGRSSLETYHHPSGRRTAVARDVLQWSVSFNGRSVLAMTHTGAGFTLVAWDIAAEGGTGLGEVATPDSLPAFGPDGRSFVYVTAFGDLVLWDAQRARTLMLEPGITSFSFGPAGDRLLYVSSGALIHWDLRTASRFEIATGVGLHMFDPDGETVAYYKLVDGAFVLTTWDSRTRISTRRATTAQPIAMRYGPAGDSLFVLDMGGALHAIGEDGARTLSTAAQALPQFAPDGTSFLFHDDLDLVWASIDAPDVVRLGGPMFGYHVAWDPSGEALLFVTGGDAVGYGDAWIFRRDTRSIEREGTGVFAARARFADDGSFLYLQRFDRSGHRGELVLDGTIIGGGVPDGFQFTADASRVLFRTDALTVREPNVIALWDENARLGCNEDEGAAMLPVDGSLTQKPGGMLVGPEYLAWVSVPAGDRDAAGVYLSHWPRDMPPPPPEEPEEPEEDEEEGADDDAFDNEAEALLPNETNE